MAKLSKEAKQLIGQLINGLPSQQESAAEKLGKLGEKHETIIEALDRVSKSGYNSHLREAAKEALFMLGNEPPPTETISGNPGSSIFCMQCGTQLPGGAKFCFNCGNPVGKGFEKANTNLGETRGSVTFNGEPQFETCEIKFCKVKEGSCFSKPEWCWMADAIGPRGTYIAEKSPVWKFPFDRLPEDHDFGPAFKKSQGALEILINNLAKDGWEFVGTYGTRDFEKRFRRRVR